MLWGGWREHLLQVPPKNYKIDPAKFKHCLHHVGYLKIGEDTSPAAMNPDNTKPDKEFSEFLMIYDIKLSQTKYGFCQGTWEAAAKAVLLFDVPPVDEPKQIIDRSAILVEDMLREFGVESRVLEQDEVDFTRTASSGLGYQQLYGNKGMMFASSGGQKELREYWDRAHIVEADPLWKVSVKNEILPLKKIIENNLRCFEIPPFPFLMFTMRLCQYFNKSMTNQWRDGPLALGCVMQHGGFDEFIKRMDKGPNTLKGMGDVNKWDKSFRSYLRNKCKQIRINLFNPLVNKMGLEEFVRRISWVYKVCLSSYFIMPWGQILFLQDSGMNSGDGNTTYDNEDGHLILYFSYILDHFPHCQNWRDIWHFGAFKLYADDHIFTLNENAAFLSPYPKRKEFYQTFGFTLKEEDDKVQKDWEGLTFLGGVIQKIDGVYIPVYKRDRIIAGLTILKKREAPKDRFSRFYALMILSTFHEDLFNIVAFYLRKLIQTLDTKYGPGWFTLGNTELLAQTTGHFRIFEDNKTKMPLLPTNEYCRQFWTGLETHEIHIQISHLTAMAFEEIVWDKYSKISLAWHGKYCGPGWSENKYQDSVCGSEQAIDQLDELCKEHDCDYNKAQGEDFLQQEADRKFVERVQQLGGIKAYLTKLAILSQMVLRGKPKQKAKAKKEIKVVEKRVNRVRKILKRGAKAGARNTRGRGEIPAAHRQKRANNEFRIKKFDSNSVVLEGKEFYSNVTTGGSAPVQGTLLYSNSIAPQALNTTRMKQFSALFDRYEFLNFQMHYTPSVGTATTGSLVHYFDPDPTDIIGPPTVDLIRDALSTKGAAVFPVYQESRTTLVNKSRPELFTSSGVEARLVYQGTYFMLADGALATNTTYGVLYFTYKVRFWSPHTQIQEVNTNSCEIIGSPATADSTAPYGTDPVQLGDFSVVLDETTGRIQLPSTGTYLILYSFKGTGIVNVGGTVNTDNTISIVSSGVYSGITAMYYRIIDVFNIAAWHFSFAITNEDCTQANVYIAKVNNNIRKKKKMSESEEKILTIQDKLDTLYKMIADKEVPNKNLDNGIETDPEPCTPPVGKRLSDEEMKQKYFAQLLRDTKYAQTQVVSRAEQK